MKFGSLDDKIGQFKGNNFQPYKVQLRESEYILNPKNLDNLLLDSIEIDNSVNWNPSLQFPSKILCIGRNYKEHAKELGNPVPKIPLVFLKPPSSLLGNKHDVILPETSNMIHHEVELAVIIGKQGKRIAPEKASEHIFGYSVFLDITARDLQRSDKTWFRGKGYDTFGPFGPWIVTKDEINNAQNLEISLEINENRVQNGNTNDMIFSIDYLISYLSQIVTLEPGDIIATGTPAGVGPINSGDKLKATIENIGTLNVVVK